MTKIDQSIFELRERKENAQMGGGVVIPFPSPLNFFFTKLESIPSRKLYKKESLGDVTCPLRLNGAKLLTPTLF